MAIDPSVGNWLAGIGATFVGALIVAIFARAAKRGDMRAAAEAAIAGMPVQIIKEQIARIDQLGRDFDRQRVEINRLWQENDETRRRERECQEELATANQRIGNLEESSGALSDVAVLIVDDDHAWATTLRRAIRIQLGKESQIVTRASEVMAQLRRRRFSVVVMDMVLDGANGVDLAIQIRRDGFDLPIIAISGDPAGTLDRNSNRGREADFAAVFQKAQRISELMREIGRHLRPPE
jgi:CheY-like chemotaxis protein